MTRTLRAFFQIVVVAFGIGVLVALLWEPWVEGVNANATTLREIYFDDPFLVYIYFAFIPVFLGLYKGFKLAGNIGRGEMYSHSSVHALRAIKYCAFAFAGYIFLAVAYIFITMRGKDDIAGGVAMGLCMILTATIVAVIATRFERIVASRMGIS